jgi:pimeloyl-ACP methyl ester carboxylesterase
MAAGLEDIELVVGSHRHTALTAGPTDGEVVLLLHGFPETASCWRSQLEALGNAGYRAVAPNQRGYCVGARPLDVSDYRLDSLVDDVLSFAAILGAERFHLVGHDWGGIVAWRLAARHPERLHTLTAVTVPHPAAFRDALGRSNQLLRSTYVALFRTPWLAEKVLGTGGNAGLRRMLERSGLSSVYADEYAEALSEPNALRAALNWYRASGPDTLRADPVEVPTLYVWAGKDPALGPEAANRTEKYVRGPYRFVPLPDAPHWIPEERPDRLNKLLVEFLQTVGEGSTFRV